MLGYTLVRATLSQSATQQSAVAQSGDLQVVVPGEGTMWSGFGTNF